MFTTGFSPVTSMPMVLVSAPITVGTICILSNCFDMGESGTKSGLPAPLLRITTVFVAPRSMETQSLAAGSFLWM